MKLLNRDRKRLEGILSDLERVQAFVLSDRFQYIAPKSMATTTQDLRDEQGHAFTCPLEKRIGTDLCLLYSAANKLQTVLNEDNS